jgi:hypothetical protein
MNVAMILVVLVVVAAVAVVIVNRATGARPDRPMAGDDDAPDHAQAAQEGSTWKADRPGDPGAEGMNPEEAGDPSAGPIDDDEPGSRA